MLMYTLVVVTVSLKAALTTESWTVWSVAAIVGSMLFWFLFVWLYDSLSPYIGYGDQLYGLTAMLYTSATFWFTIVIVPIICVSPAYIDA